MRTKNPAAELQAIVSILDGPPTVSTRLLGLLRGSHFAAPATSEIIQAVYRQLQRHSTHSLPSSRAFRHMPGLSDTARDLLRKSARPVSTTTDAKALAKTLEFYRQLRSVHRLLKNTARNLSGDGRRVSIEAIRENLVKTAENISLGGEADIRTRIPSDSADKLLKSALTTTKLIKSGFKNFDDKAGGFARGDLHVLASHRAGGKSALANALAIHFYKELCLKVAFVSLEMGRETCIRRVLAHEAEVKHESIRRGWKRLTHDERRKILRAWKAFKRHGAKNHCVLDFIKPGPITALELEMLLRPYNYDIIIIDYLNMMSHTEGDTDAARLGHSALQCKHMAERLNAAVFLLTQMDKQTELIRYSRTIEEHADLVWTWKWAEDEKAAGVTAIKQPKTRHFEAFEFVLKPILDFMTFADAEDDGSGGGGGGGPTLTTGNAAKAVLATMHDKKDLPV